LVLTLKRLNSPDLPPEVKIQGVHAALAEEYGDLEWRPSIDPLSELVLTILSQHTSDVNRDRAFDAMKRRFPTWEEVLAAPTEELADAIRPGGLANIKAPRIQEVLRRIGDERGSLDLDFLVDMPVAEARTWLSGFNGVGPKTAACVLMFACGMPVLPVDTHVYRVSQRLGLIDARTNAEKAHDILEDMLEPEQRYPFHIHMITHGRRVCKAQRPLCEACVVRDYCSYYAALVDRAGLQNTKTRRRKDAKEQ
jgi:endonuclease III